MSWWDRVTAILIGRPTTAASTVPPAPVIVARDPVADPLRDGIYGHWSEVPWPVERWPNFSAKELACPCCGEAYVEQASIDMLQEARRRYGAAMTINSAHRCPIHNAHVGGAPLSEHKKIAFDVSIRGRDRWAVLRALQQAGFTTFGFYQTFIHTDIRPGRRWYADKIARQQWTS